MHHQVHALDSGGSTHTTRERYVPDIGDAALVLNDTVPRGNPKENRRTVEHLTHTHTHTLTQVHNQDLEYHEIRLGMRSERTDAENFGTSHNKGSAYKKSTKS